MIYMSIAFKLPTWMVNYYTGYRFFSFKRMTFKIKFVFDLRITLGNVIHEVFSIICKILNIIYENVWWACESYFCVFISMKTSHVTSPDLIFNRYVVIISFSLVSDLCIARLKFASTHIVILPLTLKITGTQKNIKSMVTANTFWWNHFLWGYIQYHQFLEPFRYYVTNVCVKRMKWSTFRWLL